MKKNLLVILALLVVACSQQAAPHTTQSPQPTDADLALLDPATATFRAEPTRTILTPALSSTPPSNTATPQHPATCPAVNQKTRIPLASVFRDKKTPYHDVRTVVTNFLNAGGDPRTAMEKLAEHSVLASFLDLTHDGVPELILPSGYLTVWGCRDSKYSILLDIPPSVRNATAIPLVIQDLNQNGLLEILIGQVEGQNSAAYQILEWDGAQFASLLPATYSTPNFSIEHQVIRTVGQGNTEKGALEGNWEVIDVDDDGRKEIIIRAGVYENSVASSDLETSITLKWSDDFYTVSDVWREPTPTPSPTSTPLPFSATCAIKVPELRFQALEYKRLYEVMLDYLNAGGMPEKLDGREYGITIKDLNNDSAPEVMVFNYSFPDFIMFTCHKGKYKEALSDRIQMDFAASFVDVLAIKDNNKNGFPEVFIEAIGCAAWRCGGLYVIEWDGDQFTRKIKDFDFSGRISNYAEISEPNDAYLKDLDGDGIAEFVWTGELAPEWSAERWEFYPQRLATHVYKWDGNNYTALPVEYSTPKYRFQAVQDGDMYSKTGQYEKALQSYKLAMTSDSLDWWTEELHRYIMASHGIGPCAENATACFAMEDPNERPVLSAYASFKTMVVYLLMKDRAKAESVYQSLLTSHPADTPGHKIVQMATLFWDEYQRSQDFSKACGQSVSYIKTQPNVLIFLTGSDLAFQGINYESDPIEVCPFQ